MATPGIKPTDKTLENLQAAYNGESNAHAKYTLFAKKADAEGYCQVASLFRAAARAEQIHAQNHARVIRKLGAEPVATIEAHPVKSTRENLQTAIAGETYERDTMYPAFIQEA
jgi:rubrerythrin